MENNKSLGQYFTPAYVADFMISLSKKPKSAKVLEPSCGEGIFLKLLEEKKYTNLQGYEVDKSLKLVTSKSEVKFESFISSDIKEKFDLIIGNPPYIRWKNLDNSLKAELDENALWQKYFNSLSDYLYIFILKSVELLKEGGEIIFITPEYWVNTKNSQTLRDYLSSHGYFTDIIHFNETPIFDKVASSIIIFRYIKSKEESPHEINVVKYKSTQRLNKDDLDLIKSSLASKKVERFQRQQFPLGGRWVLAPQKVEKKLSEYEDKCSVTISRDLFGETRSYTTLGDIADIGNGMVSGLDRAFQIPSNDLNNDLTSSERRSTIKVLKAKNIDKYLHREVTPYIFLDDKVESEEVLRTEYPYFYRLLSPQKELLEKRYSYNRKINYWHWAFLRSFNLFNKESDRIFVPCKERISHKNYFRFSYVPSGIFPTQDVTAIFKKHNVQESIYYILALLNSDLVFDWLVHKGVVKGNIVEFSEKPLASIPIKRINWGKKEEVDLHEKITFTCRSYIQNPKPAQLRELNSVVEKLF